MASSAAHVTAILPPAASNFVRLLGATSHFLGVRPAYTPQPFASPANGRRRGPSRKGISLYAACYLMTLRASIKKLYVRHIRHTAKSSCERWVTTLQRARPASVFGGHSDVEILATAAGYEPLQIPAPAFFLDRPDQRAQLRYFLQNPNLRSYSAKIVKARDILVAAPSMAHRWHDIAFLEGLLDDEGNLSYPRLVLDFETAPIRRRRRWPCGILLALPLYNNYFHWMMELLPRVQLLDSMPEYQHVPFIVPSAAPSFVKETLRLAGYCDRVQFIDRGIHEFQTLLIPSALSPPSHPSPAAVAWLHRHLGQHIRRGNRRIFVSRKDALTRRLTNERDVESVLSRHGFETVIMSDYNVEAQVQLFSESEFIVGIHGAALTNLAFCFPGTHVLELFLDGWFTNAFYHTSLLRNLSYGYLVCEKVAQDQRASPEDLDTLLSVMLVHMQAPYEPGRAMGDLV